MTNDEREAWREIESLLPGTAGQQKARARRLRPGLTVEAHPNAHDYEDGMLAGLKHGLSALRARWRDIEIAAGDVS